MNDVTVSDRSGTESFHQIVSDDSCGAILTWTHLPGTPGSTDIFAQLIDKSGYVGVFVDDDFDGIGDSEEQGPDGNNPDYDGNSDGQPDFQQANVASFNTYDQQHYVTLAVPEPLLLENVQATGIPDPDAPGAPVRKATPMASSVSQ